MLEAHKDVGDEVCDIHLLPLALNYSDVITRRGRAQGILSSNQDYSVRLVDDTAPTLSTQGCHSRKLSRWVDVHRRYNQNIRLSVSCKKFVFQFFSTRHLKVITQILDHQTFSRIIPLCLIGLYTALEFHSYNDCSERYLMTLYHIKRLFNVKFRGFLSLFHDGFTTSQKGLRTKCYREPTLAIQAEIFVRLLEHTTIFNISIKALHH